MPTRRRDETRREVVQALAAASADWAAVVRTAVLEALSWTASHAQPDERAILASTILPVLQDENEKVRCAAASALRACRQTPPEVAPILLRLLATDSVTRVRAAAASALGSSTQTPATVRALA